MKHLKKLFILALLMCVGQIQAQGNGNATVRLRNGVTVTGRLVKFDPLVEVVLEIAGRDTRIPMSKVEKVEASESPVTTRPVSSRTSQAEQSADEREVLGDQKLIVTDTNQYPETITLKVNGESINMLLVRGGRMNMGFDGRYSLSMNSEPVHEVIVTSFYISEKALTVEQVEGTKVKSKGRPYSMAMIDSWDDANKVAQSIARSTGLKCRLPLECEWEYAACCNAQSRIFADVANKKKICFDWCQDYYDDFSEGNAVLTDPTGPTRGKEHVVRAFNAEDGKFNRNNKVKFGKSELGYVRLVVKAADVQR